MLRSFKADRQYLVVVPLLKEAKRVIDQSNVIFVQPDNVGNYRTKRESLAKLLSEKKNIVTTHALFESVGALARRGLLEGYDIILDEVPNVLQIAEEIKEKSLQDIYVGGGYVTIDDNGLVLPTPKWEGDHSKVSDTLSEKVFQLADTGTLHMVNQTFLVKTFCRELITRSRTFTVLTYRAEGSMLLPYLEMQGIPYVHDKDEALDFAFRRKAAELIEIRDLPELKGVKLSYSGQMGLGAGVARKISLCLRKLRRTDLKNVPLSDVLVTCVKSLWYHRGKGPKDTKKPSPGPISKLCNMFKGVVWIANTTRGTNEHSNASHLVYLYDQHPNPAYLSYLGRAGDTRLMECYALAELIQVIYRTRVRNGHKVVVYVPSPRMRRLLEEHLNVGDGHLRLAA